MVPWLRTAPRLALWMAAFALLLRAAVPLAASVAAEGRGATLFEVCTAYGVSVPTDGDAPVDGGAAGDDNCALAVLLAAGTPPAAATAWPAAVPASRAERALAGSDAPRDAAARWISRMHHGPPAFA